MDTPNQQTPWSAKAAEQTKAAPGSRMAKFSIIAAVVVVGLNFAELTVFQGRSAALTVASVAALAAVLAGLILATAGLIRAWNYSAKGAVPLAIAGLLLNGALLATGFVKAPVLGRRSAGSFREQTVTLPSGRKIITKDWTTGFVVELTNTSFNEMISESDMPVLVDFSASWCGACRAMWPAIEALAKDYEGKAKVCTLNVDSASETAAKFGVRYLPTIILFNKGSEKQKWEGVTDSEEISLAIDRLL
jgi:thioredoxin 1